MPVIAEKVRLDCGDFRTRVAPWSRPSLQRLFTRQPASALDCRVSSPLTEPTVRRVRWRTYAFVASEPPIGQLPFDGAIGSELCIRGADQAVGQAGHELRSERQHVGGLRSAAGGGVVGCAAPVGPMGRREPLGWLERSLMGHRFGYSVLRAGRDERLIGRLESANLLRLANDRACSTNCGMISPSRAPSTPRPASRQMTAPSGRGTRRRSSQLAPAASGKPMMTATTTASSSVASCSNSRPTATTNATSATARYGRRLDTRRPHLLQTC